MRARGRWPVALARPRKERKEGKIDLVNGISSSSSGSSKLCAQFSHSARWLGSFSIIKPSHSTSKVAAIFRVRHRYTRTHTVHTRTSILHPNSLLEFTTFLLFFFFFVWPTIPLYQQMFFFSLSPSLSLDNTALSSWSSIEWKRKTKV